MMGIGHHVLIDLPMKEKILLIIMQNKAVLQAGPGHHSF